MGKDRKRFHGLSKRALIDKILKLEDAIEQLERFYNLPIVKVTPDQVEAVRNTPGFVSPECYAVGRPLCGEIGYLRGSRFLEDMER